MKISFSKYQGAGNDFILVEDRENSFPDLNQNLIANLCDRRFGIGADGLMLLRPSKDKDFKMLYYNSDGLEGTMCGNGGRCLVAFARDCDWVDKNKDIVFEAIDGEHVARILDKDLISLKMIDVDKVVEKLNGYHVETGSTHHVEYVVGLVDKDVNKHGSELRYHKEYAPLGCNVNFIEDLGNGVIAIRTYERGVENETLACGTGSVASAIVHHHRGFVFDKYMVKARGGDLTISFDYKNGLYTNVYLKGPANFVYKGEYCHE